MNKALLAHLSDAERRLIQLTETAELARLDEEAALDLHERVRRARNKARGQYRRPAAGTVAVAGGRGKARDGGNKNAVRVEAFEEALSRVSRRVATLSKASADALKAERIAAAQAAKSGQKPAAPVKTAARKAAPKKAKPTTRTASATKNRAAVAAKGARRQAKRDAR